jgi:hypothetical protein
MAALRQKLPVARSPFFYSEADVDPSPALRRSMQNETGDQAKWA